VNEFRRACEENGIVVPMATVNLFYDAVFRDGAFTANEKAVRDYALQKTMRAMDLGAECGAKTFVFGAAAKEWKLTAVAAPMRR
jgi:xylose isomerase